jgi:hypothetical protein
VARYIGRHGTKRLAKAGLISAVPPLMLKTDSNPGGLPMSMFDGIRAGSLESRPAVSGYRRRPVLRLQPSRCQSLARPDLFVVGAGHAGRPQEHL